jgi:hypothetical protein
MITVREQAGLESTAFCSTNIALASTKLMRNLDGFVNTNAFFEPPRTTAAEIVAMSCLGV